jgi:hypothetical protein
MADPGALRTMLDRGARRNLAENSLITSSPIAWLGGCTPERHRRIVR